MGAMLQFYIMDAIYYLPLIINFTKLKNIEEIEEKIKYDIVFSSIFNLIILIHYLLVI